MFQVEGTSLGLSIHLFKDAKGNHTPDCSDRGYYIAITFHAQLM